MSAQIIKLGGKPNLENKDTKGLIKDLNKQLEQLNVQSVLADKTKNIIKDENINGTQVRLQKVQDLSPKDLRKLVDAGKKELGEGIVVVFANKDEKVGLAVGVTENLTNKYDAVKFAKLGSEIIGGKGGGGRKDFAQAGGQDSSKIDEALQKLKTLIYECRFALVTVTLTGFGRASAEVGAVMIVGGNINHFTRVMTTAIAFETSRGSIELAVALGLILIFISLLITLLIRSFRRLK